MPAFRHIEVKGQRHTLSTFASLHEVANFTQNVADTYLPRPLYNAMDNKGTDTVRKFTLKGALPVIYEPADSAITDQVKALSAKLETSGVLVSEKCKVPSVVGSTFSVPAVLAGHPMAMRRRVAEVSETAPLTILYNFTVNWTCSPAAIAKRAIVVAAAIHKLSTLRPVNLYLFAYANCFDRDIHHLACPYPTAPFDIGRFATLMANHKFTRSLMLRAHAASAYEAAKTLGAEPTRYIEGMPFGHERGIEKDKGFISTLAQTFRGDIMVTPLIMSDREANTISANPEAYIKGILDTYAPNR